jgi:dienelactone hydrolase
MLYARVPLLAITFVCTVLVLNAQVTRETYSFYTPDNVNVTAYFASPVYGSVIRGGVLIAHDWNGRDAFENGKADALAQLGFYAMAMDVYGRVGTSPEENQSLMRPLMAGVQRRMRACMPTFCAGSVAVTTTSTG